uniref:Nucleotide exchange factor Fes1 domain-containing protein n=1 Tax=Wuchereria bancrofti TaxID=6293 RepID=A0AAF5PXL6_WUCBA
MSKQNIVSPQCWTKLLCLAQSANDGNDGQSNQLMSKQDQKFVENAMAEAMHLTDPVRHMTKYIEQLKLIRNNDVDSVAEIVDNLEELICDIDCAADFCKLDGLVEVIRLLKSNCDPIRCEMARLIPLLAQNNPYVQNVMLETDLLLYLLNALEEINASEDLLMKVLSALSSVVRGHEKTFNQFYHLKGLERIECVFQKAVDTHHLRVANKAVLITTNIAISVAPDVRQYNILSVLLRMTLQLSSHSEGCSYFLDYLMSNIVDKDVNNSDLKSDECRINFGKLDNHSKQHFCEFLKRQLEYEERSQQKGCLERSIKMNVVLDEYTRNFKLEEVSKT